jgi:putative transposase
MDGKGRVMDNIFIERLWRSLKYEEIYLKEYSTVKELRKELRKYFEFYNFERPHQGLGSKTPAEVYFGEQISRQAA